MHTDRGSWSYLEANSIEVFLVAILIDFKNTERVLTSLLCRRIIMGVRRNSR